MNMSATEIINRIDSAKREYNSARDGSVATDMLVDNAMYELDTAIRLLVKMGILPAEALKAI